MEKKRSIRLFLAAAVAAAAAFPLVAQVRKAQSAGGQAQAQQSTPADPTAGPNPFEPPAPPATRPSVDPNKVVLSAGDIKVTAGEFDAIVASLGPQAEAAVAQPAIRRRLAEQIIQIKMLANEARHEKLDQTPEFKQQMQLQADQLLAQSLQQHVTGGKDEPGDRAYFNSHARNFDSVKARHILIRTPDSPVPQDQAKSALTDAQAKAKADQIKAKLDKDAPKDRDADFASIAKVESDDKGSGIKGGDLGEFAPYKMDPVFSSATLSLKPNEISQPVKTQFGYHIIQLLSDTPRTYEQAKSEVGEARMHSLVEELKDKSKPVFDPTFFGPSAEASSPTTRPAAAQRPAAQQHGGA